MIVSFPPRSYPNALTPQHIHAGRSGEAKPLRDVADDAGQAAGLGDAALQEGARIAETRRPVVRHEELGRGVDHRQAAALRVPGRVDGGVARLEVDLVGEEGELVQRGGDVAWLGHYCQGLLPPVVHVPVPQQPLPGQALDAGGHGGGGTRALEDGGAARREGLPLRHEVVADEAEGALGQQVRADVEVAGVAGAEGQGVPREAVLGHVPVGGGEDGLLAGVEDAGGGRVVVGMVGARARARARARGRGQARVQPGCDRHREARSAEWC